MKIHHASPSELQKMDDLLTKIKLRGFNLVKCIQGKHEVLEKKERIDEVLDEKKVFIDELRKLVREWSYVPLCASCYLELVTDFIYICIILYTQVLVIFLYLIRRTYNPIFIYFFFIQGNPDHTASRHAY
ncbi:GfV-B49-ORF1 [Ichnoviriform fumiferanae]|uniref:GfV-B49-ORF1 n=1 Tax=Ichnoviriform fumiferanae TaxID=419435 RepID=A2PZU6_9VIRU|nr:GfV-B49-ORF1 [Ichnoviriform fumiferanae]BAF45518.1 GfV-B49-ORF1 [Ichnoviriform fumiferanae]